MYARIKQEAISVATRDVTVTSKKKEGVGSSGRSKDGPSLEGTHKLTRNAGSLRRERLARGKRDPST